MDDILAFTLFQNRKGRPLKKTYEIFNKLENGFVITGIILTMLMTLVSVIMRYVFRLGAGWSEELVRFIMIWITFVGMGIAIRTGSHVSIDYFCNLLSPKKRKLITRGVHLVATFFCILLFVSSLILALNVFRLQQISAGLQIRMGYIYSMLPFAALVSTLRYGYLFFKGDRMGDHQ